MSPRCQQCKKQCKASDLKEVEVRESFDKKEAVWSKPKKICLSCLRKEPIKGNYRVAGLNVDRAIMENARRRRGQARRELTPRQKAIFDFIISSIEKYQRAPTHMEICRHLGLLSTGSAVDIVAALIKKGYIVKDRYAGRGIRLNPKKYLVRVSKRQLE